MRTPIILVACLTLAYATEARAEQIKLRSHLVHGDTRVIAAVQGSPASTAHREGTVFVVANPSVGTDAYVAEVDVERGTILHRADFACTSVTRAGSKVIATCNQEVIAFDSSLNTLWRTPTAACRSGWARRGIKLFFDGASRVVSADSCDGNLVLKVLSSEDGHSFAEFPTNLFALRDFFGLQIDFHGTKILGRWSRAFVGIPTFVFALSNDYSRIERTIVLDRSEEAWDDGVHLHVAQRRVPAWMRLDDCERPSRLTWLTRDRDYVLSDSLQPLGSSVLAPEVWRDTLMGDEMGGDLITDEFDQGRQHFWLTAAAGGSDHAHPPGLYVATVTDVIQD